MTRETLAMWTLPLVPRSIPPPSERTSKAYHQSQVTQSVWLPFSSLVLLFLPFAANQ